MKRKRFYEIILDDSRKTFEVIGLSTDDTPLTFLVCEMQEVGLEVRCATAEDTFSEYAIKSGHEEMGYSIESGLYARLKNEFARRTSNIPLPKQEH